MMETEIKVNVGYAFVEKFIISEEQVLKFAQATGDFNPLHLDKQYCLKTRFGRPIAHGLLGAAVFTRVYGNIFPGEGTIYVSQTLEFKRPIFMNIEYTSKFKVSAFNASKKRLTIDCQVIDNEENVCINGQSVLFNERLVI